MITIIRAADEDDALRIATTRNTACPPQCSAVMSTAVRFARKLDVGMTYVNDSPVNDDANTAFGGEKDSGIGRFGGQWAVAEFTTDHWVSIQHRPRQYVI